ncbi:hypothetical protein BH09PAT4_BH09PAT4_09230 [soil metagenome]
MPNIFTISFIVSVLLFDVSLCCVFASEPTNSSTSNKFAAEMELFPWFRKIQKRIISQPHFSEVIKSTNGKPIYCKLNISKTAEIKSLEIIGIKDQTSLAVLALIQNAAPFEPPPNSLTDTKPVIVAFNDQRNLGCPGIPSLFLFSDENRFPNSRRESSHK